MKFYLQFIIEGTEQLCPLTVYKNEFCIFVGLSTCTY